MGEKGVGPGATEGYPASPCLTSKSAKHCYTRDFLLSLADHESCKLRPGGLDPVLWRDPPPSEIADGGVAIPVPASRGLPRRDRESEVYLRSPQEIPEWRKDSWRPGSSGSSGVSGIQQGPRRKLYDDEVGNAFSTSYPPRPAANWGENGPVRSVDRAAGAGASGQGKWEHRAGCSDREKERRPFHDWDADELDSGGRPCGQANVTGRSGWIPSERDGLLGSGGGPRSVFASALPGNSSRYTGFTRYGRGHDQYQPTRQVKASPYVRREETDFINDETFGFDDPSSEERVEQERKRRESFELMRKQHQRQLQEYQQSKEQQLPNDELKINRKHDESSLWDARTSMDGNGGSFPKSPNRSIGFNLKTANPAPSTNHTSTSIPRPAVPPGFAKAVQLKATSQLGDNERRFNVEEGIQVATAVDDIIDAVSDLHDTSPRPKQEADTSSTALERRDHDKNYKIISVVPSSKAILENPITTLHLLLDAETINKSQAEESLEDWELSVNGGSKPKDMQFENINSDGMAAGLITEPRSVLDKLFGKASMDSNHARALPLFTENTLDAGEHAWSDFDQDSLKFVNWPDPEAEISGGSFLADSADGLSPLPTSGKSSASVSRPLEEAGISESLLQDQHSVPSTSLPLKHQGRVLPMPPGPSLEDIEKGIAAVDTGSSKSFGVLDVLDIRGKVVLPRISVRKESHESSAPAEAVIPKLPPVFLTCEDIELSIIAEADRTVESRDLTTTVPNGLLGLEGKQAETSDGNASRHLLSLLQRKSSVHKISRQAPHAVEVAVSEEVHPAEYQGLINEAIHLDWASKDQASLQIDTKTMESVFGPSFMDELRAQDKPVSMKTPSDKAIEGKDDVQQPSVSSFNSVRHTSVGNSGASKPSYGTIGRVSRPAASDSTSEESHREIRNVDRFALKTSTTSGSESVPLSPSVSQFMWANGYPLTAQESKRLTPQSSYGSVLTTNLSEDKGCSVEPTERELVKLSNPMQIVPRPISAEVDGFFGSGHGVLVKGSPLARLPDLKRDSSLGSSILDSPLKLPSSLADITEDLIAVDTRESLSSSKQNSTCSWAFEDESGGKAPPAANGSVFGKSERSGASSKSKAPELMSTPDGSLAGYLGGAQPQPRASSSAQLKGSLMRPHQAAYSTYQGQLLQQPQSGLPIAPLYRPLSSSVVGLHAHPTPLHHHLQQSLVSQGPSPGGYSGFTHQPYRPQQQMQPQFGGASAVEFPHFGYGPMPDNGGRSFPHASASGSIHFQSPPAHLGQGAYHQVGPVGPVPNQFIGPARLPQRGPFFQGMNGGPFIHDHPLHEPHGLASKQGQPGVPLFPVNGPPVHSGHNAIFHQPGHNARAQAPGQLGGGHLPPGGFISAAHYGSDVGHANKGHDILSFISNNAATGNAGIERWFGMEVNRSIPGMPGHGLM